MAGVDALLDRVVSEHGVFLPLAVESGSRAWGFASPDSDYDCRFVYVRRAVDHIKPWPVRDVIEFPLQDDFDANGWDLAKALRLLLKGNAVIIEWLRSPVVYRGLPWFRDDFLAFARSVVSRDAIARHHLLHGERQRRVYFSDGADVPQKRIFYALWPAAMLRWLRLHPEEAEAPMDFPSLIAQCDPPAALQADVADLMRRKALTRDLGAARLPAAVGEFIDAEFALARSVLGDVRGRTTDMMQQAEQFYRTVVERLEAEAQGGGADRSVSSISP
ncbi:nucleotidyltransferase domain-containing protein [Bradyrhizobium sp. ORS 375]|uniref:nucleotidyltransferase domain-containing protein n=1 Tax=Bradyrhizobium sp. (strain ORS 375) TaxID=566679 RepID=UPI001FCBAEFF|nr:nucleotidyltransferase domain-containing protein [Bradyrhizobium sp. ORS 375]